MSATPKRKLYPPKIPTKNVEGAQGESQRKNRAPYHEWRETFSINENMDSKGDAGLIAETKGEYHQDGAVQRLLITRSAGQHHRYNIPTEGLTDTYLSEVKLDTDHLHATSMLSSTDENSSFAGLDVGLVLGHGREGSDSVSGVPNGAGTDLADVAPDLIGAKPHPDDFVHNTHTAVISCRGGVVGPDGGPSSGEILHGAVVTAAEQTRAGGVHMTDAFVGDTYMDGRRVHLEKAELAGIREGAAAALTHATGGGSTVTGQADVHHQGGAVPRGEGRLTLKTVMGNAGAREEL